MDNFIIATTGINTESDTVIFFLRTRGEEDIWYWEVDKVDVENYKGTLDEFVNDPENVNLGCSCGSFATLEDATADALKEV